VFSKEFKALLKELQKKAGGYSHLKESSNFGKMLMEL
jgi:hypothetical protein